MHRRPLWTARSVLLLSGLATTCASYAQIDIVTERYDNSRLGANLQETQLDTSSVDVASFGKLWSYTVNGSVYAQPLYVRNVAIPGQGTHNLLYVVTMNDFVYAFDADSGADTPLLSLDLTTQVPGSHPNTMTEIGVPSDNIIGNVGIESTPQIDLASQTMYLVARTREMDGACNAAGAPNPTFCQRLHALDITTLAEKPGSPVVLGGSVPGSSNGSSGGVLPFDPKIEDQRASLAYANGRIFIAWSGHSDQFDYHGWVMVYDATTLQQTKIWSSSPVGSTGFNGGGIWMAGRAPVVDADGNVYYMTGNGPYDGVDSFGESFVKFGPTPDTPLLDWFTPNEVDTLNANDADLGGSGPILIPGTDLLAGAGKSGKFFITHAADMGHLGVGTGNTNIEQAFSNGGQQIKGGSIFWNRGGGVGSWMYVWADSHSALKAYHFNDDFGTGSPVIPAFDTATVSQSALFSSNGSGGGVMTLSANGGTPGSGIVWSSMATPGGSDPNSGINPGMLRALDADNLTNELWNSNQNSARDSSGNWPKFSPPTVVNGRVYLGSFPSDGVGDTQVNVYGLLQPDFDLASTPDEPGTIPGGAVTYTLTTSALRDFAGTVHFAVSGLPDGASASFSANDVAAPSSITLTVTTGSATPLGSSVLTLSATSDAIVHTANLGLHVTNSAAGHGAISVDFDNRRTPLRAFESAGVVALPNWNEITDASGDAFALVDESGAATGATLQWNAAAIGNLGIADAPGDFRMMNGYLDGGDQPITLSVTNLPDDPAGHFVYVYADGNNGATARVSRYEITSPGGSSAVDITDAADANFDGDFAVATNGGGNYAVFFVSGNNFTLTATPDADAPGTASVPLNGIQILRGDRIFANGFE
jgi:hypothetical protein